jgi:hypothetical protein
VDVKGSFALTLGHPNNVVWAGMSERFLDACKTVLDEKRVYPHPASFLAYMIDGGGLRLPLAKRPPKGGYRNEHWLPTCLRLVPMDRGKGKR